MGIPLEILQAAERVRRGLYNPSVAQPASAPQNQMPSPPDQGGPIGGAVPPYVNPHLLSVLGLTPPSAGDTLADLYQRAIMQSAQRQQQIENAPIPHPIKRGLEAGMLGAGQGVADVLREYALGRVAIPRGGETDIGSEFFYRPRTQAEQEYQTALSGLGAAAKSQEAQQLGQARESAYSARAAADIARQRAENAAEQLTRAKIPAAGIVGVAPGRTIYDAATGKPAYTAPPAPRKAAQPSLNQVLGAYVTEQLGKGVPLAQIMAQLKPPKSSSSRTGKATPVFGVAGGKPAWGIYDPARGWLDAQPPHEPLPGFQKAPSSSAAQIASIIAGTPAHGGTSSVATAGAGENFLGRLVTSIGNLFSTNAQNLETSAQPPAAPGRPAKVPANYVRVKVGNRTGWADPNRLPAGAQIIGQ